MAATMVLMILPYGMRTGPPRCGSTIFYQSFTTSYFSIRFGNWFPIVTAVLSIVVFVLLVVRQGNPIKRRSNGWKPVLMICLVICIVASPLSWLIFPDIIGIPLIALIVFCLHIFTFALQIGFKNTST